MKRWLKQNLTVGVPPPCVEWADKAVTAPLWYIAMLSAVKSVADIQPETDGTVKTLVFILLHVKYLMKYSRGFSFNNTQMDSFIQYVWQIQSFLS